MPDGIRWVCLDVHARESTVAIFDQATGSPTGRTATDSPKPPPAKESNHSPNTPQTRQSVGGEIRGHQRGEKMATSGEIRGRHWGELDGH